MSTKTKPAETGPAREDDPARDELPEVLKRMYTTATKPGARIRHGFLVVSYIAFGKAGTVTERMEQITAAVAVVRADDRLLQQYGVRLRVSHDALLRVIDLSDTGGPGPSLAEVLRREIEEPSERLVKTGRARSGDTLGVQKHPLGERLRVSLLRRSSE